MSSRSCRPARLAQIASLILLFLAIDLAHASRVRSVNLEQMVQLAGRAFHGRCVRVSVGVDPVVGQTVTHVTFVPQHSVKGAPPGPLTIKLLGNQSETGRPGEGLEGIPRFRKGEEVVLFLYPESARGLTSPVGFGQGKFSVVRDKQGRALVANAFGNQRLLEGLSVAAQRKLRSQSQRRTERSEIPLEAFLEMATLLSRGSP